MSLEDAPRRDKSFWPILLGLLLLALGGMTAAYLRWPIFTQNAISIADSTRSLFETVTRETKPEIKVETPSVRAEAPQSLPPPREAAAPILPSFDIVRVTPEGRAVIAGRAEPGAHVIVHDGDHVLGEGEADRNGEFVIVPEGHVAAGGRELTLSARGADGKIVQGPDSVIVMIGTPAESPRLAAAEPKPPEAAPPAPPTQTSTQTPTQTPAEAHEAGQPEPPPAKPVQLEADAAKPPASDAAPAQPSAPVAVLVPHDDAPARMLQAPSKPQSLALNSVDYDEQGEIRFSGSAKPSAPVRVYVDNKPVGETSTDHAGQWSMTPPSGVQPGVHQLRVDELASAGNVQRRVELPFQRSTARPAALAQGQMVVQPGSNLWRIARHTYGSGTRYTVIYLANREQIRDPNRIYPGQIFDMPAAPKP